MKYLNLKESRGSIAIQELVSWHEGRSCSSQESRELGFSDSFTHVIAIYGVQLSV